MAGRAGAGRRGPGRAGRGPFLGRPSRPGSYLVKGTSLEPLLDYLRGIGVLPEQGGGPASAADALLHEYERYLRAERGACEVTAGHYLRHAHEFLDVAGWPQDGPELDACRRP